MENLNKYSCDKVNDIFNTFANSIYAPKRELLCNKNFDKNECDIKEKCFNHFFNKYQCYTKYICDYYLVVKSCDNMYIYVFDSYYNEIDKIKVKYPNCNYKSNILSITYDFINNKIYILLEDIIFSINNSGEFLKNQINSSTLKDISTKKENYKSKVITSKCCQHEIVKPCLSAITAFKNMIFVTYEKNDSIFIALLTPNGNLVNSKYIDDDITSTSICCAECAIYILALKECKYEYIYTFDITKGSCKRKHNYCEIKLNDECRVDIECPDVPCSLDGSLCEVVRSISLIEKGIAKIITCESEKIKAAIENNSCNRELINVNNSVSKTIMNLTMLEQILKEKLETALTIYEKEKKCI